MIKLTDILREMLEEKKDACYRKVKSRYDVWPSALASGALVKCRKVGAANWGNSKNEAVIEEESLHKWFKHRAKGWVDCNAPNGKGGYKPCGRQKGEDRAKYPACRPTPGACKDPGKGKKWGKKSK